MEKALGGKGGKGSQHLNRERGAKISEGKGGKGTIPNGCILQCRRPEPEALKYVSSIIGGAHPSGSGFARRPDTGSFWMTLKGNYKEPPISGILVMDACCNVVNLFKADSLILKATIPAQTACAVSIPKVVGSAKWRTPPQWAVCLEQPQEGWQHVAARMNQVLPPKRLDADPAAMILAAFHLLRIKYRIPQHLVSYCGQLPWCSCSRILLAKSSPGCSF